VSVLGCDSMSLGGGGTQTPKFLRNTLLQLLSPSDEANIFEPEDGGNVFDRNVGILTLCVVIKR
jgi:hypothetical protein